MNIPRVLLPPLAGEGWDGGASEEHRSVPCATLSPPPSPSPVKGEGIKEGESLPEISLASYHTRYEPLPEWVEPASPQSASELQQHIAPVRLAVPPWLCSQIGGAKAAAVVVYRAGLARQVTPQLLVRC